MVIFSVCLASFSFESRTITGVDGGVLGIGDVGTLCAVELNENHEPDDGTNSIALTFEPANFIVVYDTDGFSFSCLSQLVDDFFIINLIESIGKFGPSFF
jgi:hypothetical protein